MTVPSKIRSAKITDLPALNEISYFSKQYWNYPDEWMERWKEDLTVTVRDLQDQLITVIEIDDTACGFCAIRESDDNFEITHLWITPEYIGHGYGKYLLKEAINPYLQSDKEIIVEADPNAEAFYAGQGFETFDQVESYPPGRYLPVMRLKQEIIRKSG